MSFIILGESIIVRKFNQGIAGTGLLSGTDLYTKCCLHIIHATRASPYPVLPPGETLRQIPGTAGPKARLHPVFL